MKTVLIRIQPPAQIDRNQMRLIRSKSFANGIVYALETEDGYPVEITDTFLPSYTKNATGRQQNALQSQSLGDRSQRWMIGVSCMSGCPIGCKFCATGQMKKTRRLTDNEIIEQIEFILVQNPKYLPSNSFEFKINYTRMGEPFLNIQEVKSVINQVDFMMGSKGAHHYISTIGIQGSDFSWIKDNITLQISLHSLDEKRRDELIPYKKKMTIKELGQIRTGSNLKTTINLTLVDESDFDIHLLREYFDPEEFFIKLSPINPNCISEQNNMGEGIIKARNLA